MTTPPPIPIRGYLRDALWLGPLEDGQRTAMRLMFGRGDDGRPHLRVDLARVAAGITRANAQRILNVAPDFAVCLDRASAQGLAASLAPFVASWPAS